MAPERTNADYVAYLWYVLTVFVGWMGAIILAVNLELRTTAETFAGTPLDSPAWIGLVLLATFFLLIYLGNVVGRRYGTFPPDAGWF